MTELLYQNDAYVSEFDASVVGVDDATNAIALSATAFFPGGGGQPCDFGSLRWDGHEVAVTEVKRDKDGIVWHLTESGSALPSEGASVTGNLDWTRRYSLMRTHTALHILSGIIWRDFEARVTGGGMSPGEGRLDFELGSLSAEFTEQVQSAVDDAVRRNLPVKVLFLPRVEADRDPSLLRLKANLIPRSIDPLRVIDIVGLDRQADGGTHVASTAEVRGVKIVRTESKGKANKRIRIALQDRAQV